MDLLRGKVDAHGMVSEGPLGDWLGPENVKNEPQLLWQSYYVYDLDIILQCAEILEKPEIQVEFTPDWEQARKHLGEAVRRTNTDDSGAERPPYSLMTGFIGTAWILCALSEGGMDAEAWISK